METVRGYRSDGEAKILMNSGSGSGRYKNCNVENGVVRSWL